MRHIEEQDERQWLGGEAHVRSYTRTPDWAPLNRLFSESMLMLTGLGLAAIGTVGVMKRVDRKQHTRIGSGTAHTSHGRNRLMERERTNERLGYDERVDSVGMGAVLAAFGFGLLAGTVLTVLTTPESGASVRSRLKRGVETAKKELDEVVEEVKQEWTAVGDDVSDTIKRTASRVKKAADVTKDSMTSSNDTPRSVS